MDIVGLLGLLVLLAFGPWLLGAFSPSSWGKEEPVKLEPFNKDICRDRVTADKAVASAKALVGEAIVYKGREEFYADKCKISIERIEYLRKGGDPKVYYRTVGHVALGILNNDIKATPSSR